MTGTTNRPADYYRLLGIEPGATFEEVRNRAKLRQSHPDLIANEPEDTRHAATEMTVRLTVAYECLSNPETRAAYDASSRAGTASTRSTSTPLLAVSPRTVRCDVTPGDTVQFAFDVRVGSSPGGDGPRIRTSDLLTQATFTTNILSANTASVTVQAVTSKLVAHRVYRVPITVIWGTLTGTATLEVRTELRRAGSARPSRRHSTFPSPHQSRNPGSRVRDVAAISAGGIILPLLVAAWASSLLPIQPPSNPPLVAYACAGVISATIWLLTSSRLLHQPDRLSRVGAAWGHLMRRSGWILVTGSALFLGVPAMILALMALVATPFLGLVVMAFISGRGDSRE